MTPRTPAALLAAVRQLDPEHNPRYAKRQLEPGGPLCTFCNVFATDLCTALGVALPAHTLANDLFAWLRSPSGAAAGWTECDELEAQFAAEQGRPTLAVLVEPGHGHVAAIVPTLGPGTGPHIAQAGATNLENAPLSRGFGHAKPAFFVNA